VLIAATRWPPAENPQSRADRCPLGGSRPQESERALRVIESDGPIGHHVTLQRRIPVRPGEGHAVLEHHARDARCRQPVADLRTLEIDREHLVATTREHDHRDARVHATRRVHGHRRAETSCTLVHGFPAISGSVAVVRLSGTVTGRASGTSPGHNATSTGAGGAASRALPPHATMQHIAAIILRIGTEGTRARHGTGHAQRGEDSP
jgi:hypothetical protein